MKVLFNGTMKFRTAAEEDTFMNWVYARHTAIRIEQGVDGRGVFYGWMKKRVDWEQEYLNNFAHRCADPRYGKLYELYGTSDNLPKRAIGVFAARTRSRVLGTDVFASFMPEGPEDEVSPLPPLPGAPPPIDPIAQAERYWQRKLTDGGVRHHYRSAVTRAGYVGECVVKTANTLLPFNLERTKRRLWLDGPEAAGGQPITDGVGRFIYDDDEWEASPDILGVECLRRDPETLKPPTAELSTMAYPVRDRPPKRGLSIEPVNFKDWVCSTTARDIYSTDFVGQTYDYDLDTLLNATYGAPMSKEAKAWVTQQESGRPDVEPQSESGQPNYTLGEDFSRSNDTLGKLHLAESWLRYRVNGRRTEEVYVLWDVTTRHPIFYEYMEEVSPTGRRPYDVIRAIPIPDRWYGMSFYELLSNEHNFVDLQKTRLNHRNSRNSSVKFLEEGSVAQVDAGMPFDLDAATVWLRKRTDNPNPPLQIVELQKFDEGIWQMLADARQNGKLMSGTILPSDAAAADLNESKTLGQTQLLNQESNLMGDDVLEDVKLGMTNSLKQSIVCCFVDATNPDYKADFAADVNEILGSVNGKVLLDWLDKGNPKKLLNYVRLLMTQERNREQLQANQQAKELLVGQASWLDIEAMGPQYADRFRHLWAGMLRNLDVPNGDKMLAAPALMPPTVDVNGTIVPQPGAQPGLPAPAPGGAPALPASKPPALPSPQQAQAA